MRRRELIAALASTAFWPLSVHGQQAAQERRIGLLMPYAENDPSAKARVAALRAGLQNLGWIEGNDLRIDYRYATNVDLMKAYAADLIRQSPDILVTTTNLATIALFQESKTIPIVFVGGGDMIKEGLVASLARPGGNVTGFTNFEPAMGGKWLQLLKEIAPDLHRAGFLHNSDTLANINDMRAAQAAASSLNLQLIPLSLHSGSEAERVVGDFAAESDGGLVVAPSPVTIGNHDLIVRLAAAHRLPAVYPFDFFATAGGLMSYGPDQIEMFRQASSYIDRILKGTRPGVLPVQTPTKFELIVNQKTALSIGLTVPASLSVRADRVIE